MMKKISAILAMAASLALAATAFAGVVGNVAYTVHNMSSTNPGNINRNMASGFETEICVFCHTPHNARVAVPLWNKVMPDTTAAWQMYTSSSTLSASAKKVTQPGDQSLLCLSCHDGRTAINVVNNSTNPYALKVNGRYVIPMGSQTDWNDPNVLMAANNSEGLPAQTGYSMGSFDALTGGAITANLGKAPGGSFSNQAPYYFGRDLTNDHPISFSYSDAYNDEQSQGKFGLNDPATVTAKSGGAIRFFFSSTDGKADNIECTTCHDPHVAYGYNAQGQATGVGDPKLRPFLVMSNQGSALCFACHNK